MGILQGKKAIITGSASGIGRATAMLFAQEGASLAMLDVDETGGRAAARKMVSTGQQVTFLTCDVSQAASCKGAVEEAVDRLGGIDILVNNAGIIHRANILDTSEDDWDRVMATNAKSVFLISKLSIPFMIEAGGGVIVNMGSGWGLAGGEDALSYCASKGAVVNMTRAMAIDHGHQNVRVNCVCPGDTDTPLLREEARQLGRAEASFYSDAADRPLQRVGSPEDIARAVLYLASEASSYVTGITLVVDGGGLA